MAVYYKAKVAESLENSLSWYVVETNGTETGREFWIETSRATAEDCKCEIADGINKAMNGWFDVKGSDIQFSLELDIPKTTEENRKWAEDKLSELRNSSGISAEEKAEILILDKFVEDLQYKTEMGIFWDKTNENTFLGYCDGIIAMYEGMYGTSDKVIAAYNRTAKEILKRR